MRTALLLFSVWVGACGTSNDSTPTKPAWTADSQAIALTCGGFFSGSMGFRATRDQLSATELALLSSLSLIEPKERCAEDLESCRVAITSTSGEVKTYYSVQLDAQCPAPSSPVISYDSLTPFLQTLGCRYSKAAFRGTDPGVVPDSRCKNGLFTSGPGTVAVNLLVAAPATHHIQLEGCNGANQLGKLTATLQLPPDPSPLTTLDPVDATSSGLDGACASVDYAFAQPGTYQLSIVIADGYLPVGDFFLEFY
jgi:hypothetical protein